MSFGHMKTLISLQGGTIRQSKINDGKLLMKNQFYDDPSYRDSFVIWEHGKKLKQMLSIPIKIFKETFSSANGFTSKFHVLVDDMLSIGTVLYDKKRDIYYLCIESYDRDEILSTGKLVRCNNWLKWQDNKGNIYNYPVFDINSTQYNSGIASDKTMVLGSTQHMLTITADENTIALEHDKRFFSDRNKTNPTVVKLTQNDTTAMNYDKGLLKITVEEDEYDHNKDNVEHWLCDYIKSSVVEDESKLIEIAYIGSPQLRTGGNNKTFTAHTDNTVEWFIKADNFQSQYLILTAENNICKIKCLSNEKLIGTKFVLKCTDELGNKGEVEILIIGGI